MHGNVELAEDELCKYLTMLTEVFGPIFIKLEWGGGWWMGTLSFASAPVLERDSE